MAVVYFSFIRKTVLIDHLDTTFYASSRPTMTRFTFALFFNLLTSFVLANPAHNYPTLVRLRVEGDHDTIFDKIVLTRGHSIKTASGERHRCDGTNNHAQPIPGPTALAALDDASRIGHFTWDG